MKAFWSRHLAAVLTMLALAAGTPNDARAEERILWFSISDGLTNTTNLQNAIDFAVANRYNAICVLARYRANAYYIPNRNFSTFPNPENQASGAAGDTLQFAIDRGREAGLRVYAAFGCFLVTDNSNTLPAHISSDWVTHIYKDVDPPVATNDLTYSPDPGFPRAMVASDNEGLWVDPGITAVRTYTRNVMRDIVQNYDIDGIILDRIRYPGDASPHRTRAYGYNPTALSNMGLGATPAPGSSAFITARRNAITSFVTDGAADLHALKPWVIYGSSPIIYGTSNRDTYNGVFQYFPDWNNAANPNHTHGLGNQDFVAPQYYRTVAANNNTAMGVLAPDINQARMQHHATFSTGSGAAVVAQGICDARGRGFGGFGLFAYTSANTGGFMTTLNATSTTPCGSGVMSTASPPANFTQKIGWDTVKPNNVTDLAARASSTGQVILTWSTPPPAADGDRPVRYLVYRSSTTPVRLYYSNLVNRNFDVTGNSLVDGGNTGLTTGLKHYRVIPVDDYNNKGGSNEVTATPVIATVIVESRTAAGATTASPGYAETGSFSNTTSKSTAPGVVGSGTRFSTTVGNSAAFRPAIPTAGNYDVYVTLAGATGGTSGPNNNALANYTITRDGADITGSVRLAPATTGLPNQWLLLASNVRFAAGAAGAAGGISFTNVDGNSGTGARFCMDAVKFERTTGHTAEWSRDTFDTGTVQPPGAATGWSSFGFDNALAFPSHAAGAYRAHVNAAAGKFRVSGVIANAPEWMPAGVVGSTGYVRAKFFVYSGGQTNPAAANQVPNMRLRVANRFAVTSMLEVYTHLNGDPEQDTLAQDLRPSTDPAKPSLYRVDLDPVDVPYLRDNPAVEGFQRAFEAYSTDPQDNGFVAMTESSISVYPASAVAGGSPVKVYAPSASDAGDLKQVAASDTALYRYVPGPAAGDLGTAEFNAPVPTMVEGPAGVTLDTSAVPASSIGIAVRNINPDRGTNNHAARVRVEPDKQYRVRFHLVSTQNVNAQPQLRLRARSAKFAWSQKMELGGSWATDVGKMYPLNPNNSIAQQALPGIGTQNPERIASENGGWYTVLVHTPLSADIRPEFAAGTALTTRMPNLATQPGPGVASPSRLDLLFGFDIIDTISTGMGAPLEQGNVTLDRIEVYRNDLVPD